MKKLGGDLSFCPVCHVKIERTQGCNKMTCASCGNEWCWVCGVSIKGYKHFEGGNGCGAGTSGEQVGRDRINLCKIIYYFILVVFMGIFIGLIVPILILFCPVLTCVWAMNKKKCIST